MLSRGTAVALALLASLPAGSNAAAAPSPPPAGARCSAQGCKAELLNDITGAVDAMTADDSEIAVRFGKAWLGADQGDVTLVVFADYACVHCREAQPALDQLVAADPGLRIVYRILVSEPAGQQSAAASLAVAQLPGADWTTFHRALDAAGAPTRETIMAAARRAGIDPDRLGNFALGGVANDVSEELNRNSRYLTESKAKGVPAWVIGDGMASNDFRRPTLQAAVAAARAARKAGGH